jgi:hypothetical protein
VTTLEFRIPISPSAGFFSSVRLIAVSLAQMGPPYSLARILVSVGDCADIAQVRRENPWADDYPIEWRIVPHDLFEAARYFATGRDRYLENARADVVVMCDADTCPIDRLDMPLRMLCGEEPKIAGLQAHYAPFPGSAAENEATWRKLLTSASVPHQELLTRRYSMDPDGRMGWAPPYFNYGFVAFNRCAFERIAPIVHKYTLHALGLLDEPFFAAQVGLTLAAAAAQIPTLLLDHAYNCANDEHVFSTGLRSEEDIKIIHYLRPDEFDRRTFLSDPAEFEAFLNTPKRNRVNERLRQHVLKLHDLFVGR